MKKIFGILLVLLGMYACTTDDASPITNDDDGGGPVDVAFDRTAMLTNWADNIIIPGYQDFGEKVAVMTSAANTFSTNRTLTELDALRAAWLEAYITWQRVSMFETGPAESSSLRLNLNIYPASTSTIDENATSGNYDLSLSSNRSAKGFPALDYLLYGQSTDELIALYNGASGDLYVQYLLDIVQDIELRAIQVKDAWVMGYRDDFIANNGASASASVDVLVNDFIFYYERFLRAGKMGIPGGVFSGNVEINTLEARFEGTISNTLFITALQATQDFFNGKTYNSNAQGESLNSYLNELNTVTDGADLSAIINNQFDTARAAVHSLGNFKEALENTSTNDFLEAYQEVQRLVPLLKVDMVSAMSINIDFADADGD